jgi:hypothetical protein
VGDQNEGPLVAYWVDGAFPPDYKPRPITSKLMTVQFDNALATAHDIEAGRYDNEVGAALSKEFQAEEV